MKTTYKDFGCSETEVREHERTATIAQFGKSYCHIICPFCFARVRAYIWSLSGGGKRCPCGALHDNNGQTHKRAAK